MAMKMLRRIGRRGLFLLLIGSVWALNGMSLIIEPPPSLGAKQHLVIQYMAPLSFWGWTFIAGGILSIVYAFRKRRDFPGFVGAVSPCVFWGSIEIISFFLGTYDRGLIASFVWVLCTCLILVVAGWREPEPLEENGRYHAHPGG
jgi:hypothetical protein